ncbi:MAG: maleylpyruvate isomerase N-terminal domain-containing protein, partial [Acidimicrobiia bacterium]|nr:maleylpyruvate isomerase N-terminal domain-containing protein [Acidimicrobiia bacterium]
MGGTVRQYYEPPGAPMVVPATHHEVTTAWVAHRERLRAWLRGLPSGAWDRPTRCSGWCVTDLVEHLISGSQFLGYTLHQSRKGEVTHLLAQFDPQATPREAAAMFAGRAPGDLLDALDENDG